MQAHMTPFTGVKVLSVEMLVLLVLVLEGFVMAVGVMVMAVGVLLLISIHLRGAMRRGGLLLTRGTRTLQPTCTTSTHHAGMGRDLSRCVAFAW